MAVKQCKGNVKAPGGIFSPPNPLQILTFNIRRGLLHRGGRIPLGKRRSRKVRTTQRAAPPNGWGFTGLPVRHRKCRRKLYRHGFRAGVRVKTCGKSARFRLVTASRDKPRGLKCHVHPGRPGAVWLRRATVLRAQVSFGKAGRGRQLDPVGDGRAR